jgi:hypothetical protein
MPPPTPSCCLSFLTYRTCQNSYLNCLLLFCLCSSTPWDHYETSLAGTSILLNQPSVPSLPLRQSQQDLIPLVVTLSCSEFPVPGFWETLCCGFFSCFTCGSSLSCAGCCSSPWLSHAQPMLASILEPSTHSPGPYCSWWQSLAPCSFCMLCWIAKIMEQSHHLSKFTWHCSG